MMKYLLLLAAVWGFSGVTYADMGIEPYASISEKKSIKSDPDTGTQKEEVVHRTEYGARFHVGFWKLFKFQVAAGTSKVETTTSENEIVDEYDEIDFTQDVDLSGRTPGVDAKVIETQNKAKLSLVIDPSFSIFIMRAYFGVTAMQRIVEIKEEDVTLDKVEPDPTYNPHMGFGLGVRLSKKMYAVAEYEFYLYSFPEMEPFERSVTVSYGVSI